MADRVLVTGSLGQIGTELVLALRKHYGTQNVIASDLHDCCPEVLGDGPYERIDVLDTAKLAETVKKYSVTKIVNLAALLSAVAENKPALAYQVNLGGLFNILELARETGCSVFTPSSIAAFGPGTPADNTPQTTIQRPNTMYGVTKVAGEILADYYFYKFNVDTRGVRFPGLISYAALPGGGTTDYAVHIYYEALKQKAYTSYIAAGTYMDMMYMPDALDAIITLMEADPARLNHRNAYNITAMSFEPEMLAAEIRKHIPEFKMSYDVDPVRQAIADSWPNSLDDQAARDDWGWNPKFDLSAMTTDMLAKLKDKGI